MTNGRVRCTEDAEVSVVIPTFNRRQLLPQAIDSVFTQTLRPREIIVVDDGSTDDTGRLFRDTYEGRVSYYRQSNQGVSAARNLGARRASGKYLAFLDSDDSWVPEKLERQVAAIESRRDEHACAVFSSGLLMDRDGKITRRRLVGRRAGIQDYDLERFVRGISIFCPMSNMLIRKTCFDEVGGLDCTIRYGEDWDLVVRLRAKWSFLYIDAPLFRRRMHPTSSQSPGSGSTVRTVLADHLRTIRKSAHFIPDPGRKAKVVRETKSDLYRRAAHSCLGLADWDAGVEFLVRATELGSRGASVLPAIGHDIGSWGAQSAIERISPSSEAMCQYFRDQFLQSILRRMPERIPISPDFAREACGAFFRDLAFGLPLHRNRRLIRAFCRRALSFRPPYIVSIGLLSRYARTILKTSPAAE